jgi:hypothetical protein
MEPKFHYYVHNSTPLVLISSKTILAQDMWAYLFLIL